MAQANRKITPKVLSFDNPVQAKRSAGVKTAKQIQNTVGVSLKKSRLQHWLRNGFGMEMNDNG
jgi:phage antirepressor YoqD-like protein